MTETLGVRLRRFRVVLGLSQNQLAGRSGIPKSRLSRYENDHLLPSIPTLGRLASALGISQGDLLSEERAPIDAFAEVLQRRGIRLESVERARELAEEFADHLGASEASSSG